MPMHPSPNAKRLITGLLFIGTLLLAAHIQAYGFKQTADRYLMPGYRQLVDATEALNRSSSRYCNQPSGEHFETLRDNYRAAFLAWQTVQPIRFGPVQYLNRDYRFELWPDKRDSVTRHLGQLRADPDLLTERFDISGKSAAVQGFSALEQLLFSDPPTEVRSCRLIRAISANLARMASGTLQDWLQGDEPYLQYFTHPNPDNPMFESEPELAGQLLNSLYNQLEVMLTQKLDRPLGETPDKARGSRAEGWRSGTSLAALERNLEALRSIVTLAFGDELNPALAQRIAQQFDAIGQSRRGITLSLDRAVLDEVQRARVLDYRQALSGLKQLISIEMADALGLSLGFNSLDGD